MKTAILAFVLAFIVPLICAQDPGDSYVPVRVYDPQRDPAKDLNAAIREAQRTQRNILLDVGGNWCKWCHYLDRFFQDHPDLSDLREKNYVVMYVNISEENQNEKFLSQFPQVAGAPHLFVLNTNGKLIKSENTSELEDGRSSYVPGKVRAFLSEYGPKS